MTSAPLVRSRTINRTSRFFRAATACALFGVAPGALTAAPIAANVALQPTVRVVVVRAQTANPASVVLIVRVEGTGLVLGSYQGQFRFDPAAFAVDSSVAMGDGSRFVNAADAARGIVRFGGFTTNGFTGAEAIRVVGRALKPLEKAGIQAVLEVAGDLFGKPVPKAALIAASGVAKS
jgi:hypothetical protein